MVPPFNDASKLARFLNRRWLMVPHCARPTRAFPSRALREHRGPLATSLPLAAPETISLPPSVL